MAHPFVSKKKAHAGSTALFLIGLAVLIITESWWPGILIVVGIPLAVRQFLLGRTYDMMISLFIFVGAFVTVQFDISWRILLPILFTLGALYILFREFIGDDPVTEEEKDEDVQHEIEEKKK